MNRNFPYRVLMKVQANYDSQTLCKYFIHIIPVEESESMFLADDYLHIKQDTHLRNNVLIKPNTPRNRGIRLENKKGICFS